MTFPPSTYRRVCRTLCAAVCVLHAVGAATTVPAQPHRRQQIRRAEHDAGRPAEPVAAYRKSEAPDALDRALARPTVAIADAVSLGTRAGGRSPRADGAGRATLGPAEDKSAELDDEPVSTGADVQEGRGRKKKRRTAIRQAIMMAGMMTFAVLGPMAVSYVAMFANKALVISIIALITTGLISMKKLLQPSKSSHGSPVSHSYNRNFDVDAHSMVYSGYAY